MLLYADESGSITMSTGPNNRYFVVSYVETTEPVKVSRVFRKAKVSYIKNNPSCGLSPKDEIKGSNMSIEFKEFMFSEISRKTDATFHYIVFDNYNAESRLRRSPSITFNYLVSLKLSSILQNRSFLDKIELKFDNRNCAVYGLNSLAEYLEIEFCLRHARCQNIDVKYHESDKKELIQLADIFSNTVFRMCKFHDSEIEPLQRKYERNKSLHDNCNLGHKEFFPRRSCELGFFS